jgi:hypothetical protein
VEDMMNIDYFNEYLNYTNKGLRIKAKEYINKIIHSFEDYYEKELWTLKYLPKLNNDSNGRIRNELFEEIIFPVLLNGYNNKNINLTVWLVKLSQNYYQNNRIWKKINYKSSLEIIRKCYELEPNNNEIIDLYFKIKIERMDFCIHEYPYGILYGNNFATKEECKILLEEIPFLIKLDRNKKYMGVII